MTGVALERLSAPARENTVFAFSAMWAAKALRSTGQFQRGFTLLLRSVLLEKFRHRQTPLKLNSIHRHDNSPRLSHKDSMRLPVAHQVSQAEVSL